MKISLLGTLCAVACTLAMASSASATSDLACNLSQNAQEASGNIAALLSRGYLAAGHKYSNGSGGVNDQTHESVFTETMDLGEKLILTHEVRQTNGTEKETFSVTVKGNTLKTDKQVFNALMKVSEIAQRTLSADDQWALTECNHMVAQYIGVSPQPDPPVGN
jgi:hypothetical protein